MTRRKSPFLRDRRFVDLFEVVVESQVRGTRYLRIDRHRWLTVDFSLQAAADFEIFIFRCLAVSFVGKGFYQAP